MKQIGAIGSSPDKADVSADWQNTVRSTDGECSTKPQRTGRLVEIVVQSLHGGARLVEIAVQRLRGGPTDRKMQYKASTEGLTDRRMQYKASTEGSTDKDWSTKPLRKA
jgi:hypothetical protein